MEQPNKGTLPAAEIVCEEVTKQFPIAYGKAKTPGGAKRPPEEAVHLAVDHVSFTVEAGSLVVLLGPSGCGKTTLLKMVNRLYEATSGKIWIGGTEIHDLHATELRRHIGYVIQQVGLFPHMRIADNVSVVPRLLGWERDKTEERVRYLMDLVGLPPAYLARYPRQLSGGEQQRVGLVRALAADPAILLMDEPFAAIDAINRERLQGELLEIQRKVNKTILFVTHDVEEAFRLADQIVVMRSGKLIQYGTPLEIVTRPQNEFVQELVGAQNMLRRLSLIDVRSILEARLSWASENSAASLQTNHLAEIHPEDDLRSTLSLLLDSGGDALRVVDRSGREIGKITFADLRLTLARNAPKIQEKAGDELSDR
ncbi:MAG: ABC transporter ATP-binding protein [Chloroflexi bacterium]|nr:ABC transporter ATP-binding protein [Chloroflexota bacterium]